MHKFIELPKGKRARDVLPQFAGVHQQLGPIGIPSPFCPSCAKPFRGARKPRRDLLLYPANPLVLSVVRYRLCGLCAKRFNAGGRERDDVLAAVERFIDGSEATK